MRRHLMPCLRLATELLGSLHALLHPIQFQLQRLDQTLLCVERITELAQCFVLVGVQCFQIRDAVVVGGHVRVSP